MSQVELYNCINFSLGKTVLARYKLGVSIWHAGAGAPDAQLTVGNTYPFTECLGRNAGFSFPFINKRNCVLAPAEVDPLAG
jgi:hypothetical protein